MQSWFFLGDCKKPIPEPPKKMSVTKEQKPVNEVLFQQWVFSVKAPEVSPKEKVFLSGNIPELGEWDIDKSVPMQHEHGTEHWTKSVTIPNTCDVLYRYAICSVMEEEGLLVRCWETHLEPRVITENMLHPTVDTFGEYEHKNNVSRGWLTKQTLVQFKFIRNPLKLKSRKAGRLMNIKVTPVKLSFGSEPLAEDCSLNADSMEAAETPQGVSLEVATLDNNKEHCMLHHQEQFGTEYKPDDVLLVNVYAPEPKSIAYLIDFYAYSSRAASEDTPCHVGYTYVLPNMFKPSEGSIELPVTCNVKHRPLGCINIEYLIVKPMPDPLCNLKVSFANHWNPSWTGLEVGHRGLGASFKRKGGNAIRENTVASLKKAAASGADMLEFDVQLSKDMIPVIYHDYHVCISMKRKKEVDFSEMLELPVKDLTLEHLQKLKVYHLVEGRSNETLFDDEDLLEHQPFPTLQLLFEEIDAHVGFNVELKWNMELENGTFELNNPFDMNTYVDKVLEVVLKHAGDRRVIFSCFNPDICTMVRNKQNKYPVMFLTQGETSKYPSYRDPRCISIPAAVQNAVSANILGIVVHTEDLLRDPTQVKMVTDAGLVIFCWGDDNNDKNTINKLKLMGLHAVIYDKLDEFSTKERKESIFLVEARESQRELIGLAAMEQLAEPRSALSGASGASGSSGSPPPPRTFLDLRVRDLLKQHSTATSLASLATAATAADLRDDNNALKRSLALIATVDKESQLKQQTHTFRGLFPSGDNTDACKKSRNE